ncbi:peroxiredoxin [Gluconacetobacter aggeris]|uniref:Peroxiredoxin n=1 Tax=Gluconacetobacter aggeris TaxID=1286186 RepID=A0A7W4IS64_9PROT|nr:peroxiredoxin [Gluconacetobacter aggeris]MBB2168100.1 peroxiredoxin [Gluconacetobacter aggeris]
MALFPGWTAPDFACDTTSGPVRFHTWLGSSWGVVLTHLDDYTFQSLEAGMAWANACTRPIKVLGLDSTSHEYSVPADRPSVSLPVPRLIDPSGAVQGLWHGIAVDIGCKASAFDDDHVVYFLDPAKTIRMTLSYPISQHRDFSEVVAILHALEADRHCGCRPALRAA